MQQIWLEKKSKILRFPGTAIPELTDSPIYVSALFGGLNWTETPIIDN